MDHFRHQCHSLLPQDIHCSFHSSSDVDASRIIFLSIATPIFSNWALLQPKYWLKDTLLPGIFRWRVVTEWEMLICALFSGQLQSSMQKYWQLHNVSSQVYPESSKLMEKSLSDQHSHSINHFTEASPRRPLRGRPPLHLSGEEKLDFSLEWLCSGIRLQNGYSHQHTRLDGSAVEAAFCSFWRPLCCFLHEWCTWHHWALWDSIQQLLTAVPSNTYQCPWAFISFSPSSLCPQHWTSL